MLHVHLHVILIRHVPRVILIRNVLYVILTRNVLDVYRNRHELHVYVSFIRRKYLAKSFDSFC